MSDVVAKQTIHATVNNSASINGRTNVPVIRYVKDTDLYPVIEQYIVEHEISNGIEALETLAGHGIITPAYRDGVFYTDASGAIYVL